MTASGAALSSQSPPEASHSTRSQRFRISASGRSESSCAARTSYGGLDQEGGAPVLGSYGYSIWDTRVFLIAQCGFPETGSGFERPSSASGRFGAAVAAFPNVRERDREEQPAGVVRDLDPPALPTPDHAPLDQKARISDSVSLPGPAGNTHHRERVFQLAPWITRCARQCHRRCREH